jgi:hypothetical protein
MVGTDPTETKFLATCAAVITKFLGVEDAIIRMVAFDCDIKVSGLLFDDEFPPDGVTGREGTLRMVKDFAAAVIDVDTAAMIAVTSGTMAGRSNNSTNNRRYVMITTQTVARGQVTLF